MTDQVQIQAILAALLSNERTSEERLKSLESLQDFLKDEPVALALGAAAREERDGRVRRAMVQALLAVDITRFVDKEVYLDHVFHFAETEPESELRRLAVQRLAGLVSADERIQDLLVETLVYELNEDIQSDCLQAIERCPSKSAATVESLIDFARYAPQSLRPALLKIYAQFEKADAERGLLALLNPLEEEKLRGEILLRISELPSLSTQVANYLSSYFEQESKAELQQLVVRILANAIKVDPAVLQGILDRVRNSQDQVGLLNAFRDRLFSFPAFIQGLQRLYSESTSTQLKLELLRQLDQTESVAVFTGALSDSSPWVRSAAIAWCKRYLPTYPEVIATSVAARIAEEPLVELRGGLIDLLQAPGYKPLAVEQFLLRWISCEPNPVLAEKLAVTLPSVTITDDNRQDILNAYLRVLREPFYSSAVKDAVSERLKSFAFQNCPELKTCLQELLLRATDLLEVEQLYDSLRTLEPDAGKLVDLIRVLLLRFIGSWAQDPMTSWLRDLKAIASSNEEIRRQIPYFSRLTGASWILEAGDVADQKANLLGAILEELRRDNSQAAKSLLEDAFQQRKLRRSDLIALFRRQLNAHDQYPLLDDVIRIMTETKVSSSEILNDSFHFLSCFPQSNASYSVRSYLEQVGAFDSSYMTRVRQSITRENFRSYCLNCTDPHDENSVPPTWDDSSRWRLLYREWPLADLFFALDPEESLWELLAEPLDEKVPVLESLHYLLLHRMFVKKKVGEAKLEAIGKLMESSRQLPSYALLYDRAVYAYSSNWLLYLEGMRKKSVPENLSLYAADAFAEQCRRWVAYRDKNPRALPVPLPALNIRRLEERWGDSQDVIQSLFDAYALYLEDERPDAVKDPPLLTFSELGDLTRINRFLVLTTPSDAMWEERFKQLLGISKQRTFLNLSSVLQDVPESQLPKLLASIG
jgi:hypothetical protein